jgi:hypothetical protein
VNVSWTRSRAEWKRSTRNGQHGVGQQSTCRIKARCAGRCGASGDRTGTPPSSVGDRLLGPGSITLGYIYIYIYIYIYNISFLSSFGFSIFLSFFLFAFYFLGEQASNIPDTDVTYPTSSKLHLHWYGICTVPFWLATTPFVIIIDRPWSLDKTTREPVKCWTNKSLYLISSALLWCTSFWFSCPFSRSICTLCWRWLSNLDAWQLTISPLSFLVARLKCEFAKSRFTSERPC